MVVSVVIDIALIALFVSISVAVHRRGRQARYTGATQQWRSDTAANLANFTEPALGDYTSGHHHHHGSVHDGFGFGGGHHTGLGGHHGGFDGGGFGGHHG